MEGDQCFRRRDLEGCCLKRFSNDRRFQRCLLQRRRRSPSPRAIRIPVNATAIIPDNAFCSVPRLRHALEESGFHTVGAVWQSCHQLQLVKLPDSAVCIKENAFQGCYALTEVIAPKCANFGRRALLNAVRFNPMARMKTVPTSLLPGPGLPV